MSLPEPWVDRIFDKLAVTYGAAWLRMWEGVETKAVKANWGQELSGFQQQPSAIAYGLENLPLDRPPTVLQFRELCRRSPPAPAPRLESPAPNPERVAEALAEAQRAVKRGGAGGGLQWAVNLQECERLGRTLTEFQRKAWREALGQT